MSERDPVLEAKVDAISGLALARSLRLNGDLLDLGYAEYSLRFMYSSGQISDFKTQAYTLCTEVESAVRGNWVHDTSQHPDTPDPEPWDDVSIELCLGKALVNNTSIMGNDPVRRLHDVQSAKAVLTELGVSEHDQETALREAFKGMAEGKYND